MSIETETRIQTAAEITLANARDTFLYKALLGTSDETLRWYKCRVGLFVTALGEETKISDVTDVQLIDWWRGLEKRTKLAKPTLTPDSFHGYVRAARKFLNWLYARHLIVENFIPLIPLPNLPERQRKGVRDDLVKQLIQVVKGNIRDLAIILFMESSGARRGGVATLTLDDIEPDSEEPYCRRAAVHEKGLRTRVVMMSPQALSALKNYLAIRPASTSNRVFLDERPGKQNNGLEPGAINQMIARYKKALGITGPCSPHQWRHRFTRNMIKKRMPLSTVQQLLGHKSVNITASIYGNLLVDELQESYDKLYTPPPGLD